MSYGACTGAVVGVAEICMNNIDDNCNGIIDEGCGLRTGLVQFAIAWDEPKADVDLRVFDPRGELVEAGRPARSGLVKERDCPGRNNECHGQNLENVYLSDGDPLRGEYRVRVRLEALRARTARRQYADPRGFRRACGAEDLLVRGVARRARRRAGAAFPSLSALARESAKRGRLCVRSSLPFRRCYCTE